MASKAAYGANPNAGINVNADHGWGGYQWPAGVPSNLLGTTDYQQVNGAQQRIRLTCRRELVPLFELAFELADRKHNYQIWVINGGIAWGPWGYENRPISGTDTASNHSKGKAFDCNAPNNPYSSLFITDLPPALVSDWERIGLCWGGRYSGRQDTMHFEYGYSPDDVARHISLARQLLGREPAKPGTPAVPGKPTTPDVPAPTLEEDMALIVIRDGDTGDDYLIGAPFTFVRVESAEAYDRYLAAKIIDVEHGHAPSFRTYEVSWYRDKILAWRRGAGLPGAENVDQVRSA